MSKLDQYKCDLCRNIRHADDVYGVKWVTSSSLMECHPNEANTHLCGTCWAALVVLLTRIPATTQ